MFKEICEATLIVRRIFVLAEIAVGVSFIIGNRRIRGNWLQNILFQLYPISTYYIPRFRRGGVEAQSRRTPKDKVLKIISLFFHCLSHENEPIASFYYTNHVLPYNICYPLPHTISNFSTWISMVLASACFQLSAWKDSWDPDILWYDHCHDNFSGYFILPNFMLL